MLEKGDSGVWSSPDTPPDYYDVWIIPDGTPGTIPTKLSDLSDDTTHRVVTDAEKTTWNNKSSFSGSYNDLTNKPNLTVYEQLSNKVTSISSDSTDTEYPSAKATYTYVNNKVIDNETLTDDTTQTYSGRIIGENLQGLSTYVRNNFVYNDNILVLMGTGVTEDNTSVSPSYTKDFTKVIELPTGFTMTNSVVISAGYNVRSIGSDQAGEQGEYTFGYMDNWTGSYAEKHSTGNQMLNISYTNGFLYGKGDNCLKVEFKVPKDLDTGKQFTVDYKVVIMKIDAASIRTIN